MQKLILAGGYSVYNLADLKKRFASLGYEVSFIDAPFMADLPQFSDDKKLISFTAEFPVMEAACIPDGKNSAMQDAVVVPLSEFWISQAIKNGCRNISSRALKASRSKEYLNELLKEYNLASLKIFDGAEEAESFVKDGGRIVVKPKGLHSGYGIEILDKDTIGLLEKYTEEARTLKNRTLRIMEIENNGVMLTESLEGQEYSADAFWYKGQCHVVRLCKKRVILLQNKPCAAVYQLMEHGEEPELEKRIVEWMTMLFDRENVSFGQFDFIECNDGRVVPIDFASRVGGGITNLMRTAGRGYADWISGGEGAIAPSEQPAASQAACDFAESCSAPSQADSESSVHSAASQADSEPSVHSAPSQADSAPSRSTKSSHWTQFNYLPVTSGYVNVETKDYNLLPGHQEIFKKKGDYVISNPSSVGSRIATVVTQWPDSADKIPLEVIQSLLLDITTSKKL